VDFSTVDYASIARGFGLQSRQILDPEQIRPALEEALADGRPWFIDFVTESQITETPPVAAWREAEAHSRLATVAS
jgi:acetolactate synthase-1/2/3 large subunit